MNKKVEKKSDLFDVMRGDKTPYPRELERFLAFLEEGDYSKLNTEAIEGFLKSLEKERPDGRSPERIIRYSASSFNQHLKAVKAAVRYALDHSPEIGNGMAYQIEKYLRSLRLKKTTAGISKAERVPTGEEIEVLIEKADPRLRCMIEFLKETSCRVSEMLQAEVRNARRGKRITRIAVEGKGGKQRDLKCRTALFERIIKMFRGQVYLFEHNGRQYSRISVTNRIKDLAEKTIGKSVSAHMIRHYRGTVLSDKLGISKASSELGHSDISTTKKFYDHTIVTDAEYLQTLD